MTENLSPPWAQTAEDEVFNYLWGEYLNAKREANAILRNVMGYETFVTEFDDEKATERLQRLANDLCSAAREDIIAERVISKLKTMKAAIK